MLAELTQEQVLEMKVGHLFIQNALLSHQADTLMRERADLTARLAALQPQEKANGADDQPR